MPRPAPRFAVGMLVDDVLADADMDGHGHAQPVARSQHTDVPMRVIPSAMARPSASP